MTDQHNVGTAWVSFTSGIQRRILRFVSRILPSQQGSDIHVPRNLEFTTSTGYWNARYRLGGTSGLGSYGHLARFKAETLNNWIGSRQIASVIEFGCGDGNQLSLAKYQKYVGLDVSRTAIQKCKTRFADDLSKSFFLYDSSCFVDRAGLFKADLSLSLDVIYHLIEDEIYKLYIDHLFAAADRYVIIYSSDTDSLRSSQPHVRHRCFSRYVRDAFQHWVEIERIPNNYPADSCAEFVLFAKKDC